MRTPRLPGPRRAMRRPARPLRAGTFGTPEDAEGRQHDPDDEFHGVLRDAGQRSPHRNPGEHDDDDRRQRGDGRQRNVVLIGAEGQRDEGHLQAFQQNPLESEGKGVPVGDQPAAIDRCSLGGCKFGAIDGGLVMHRLEAGGPQDRLSQPLQTKDQQQTADNQAQCLQRNRGERRAQPGDDQHQDRKAASDSQQCRTPVSTDASRQDDRQRFDSLHRAREEDRDKQSAAVHRQSLRVVRHDDCCPPSVTERHLGGVGVT